MPRFENIFDERPDQLIRNAFRNLLRPDPEPGPHVELGLTPEMHDRLTPAGVADMQDYYRELGILDATTLDPDEIFEV